MFTCICFQIQCQCPVDDMTGSAGASEIAGTSTDSSEAKTIYHVTCGKGKYFCAIVYDILFMAILYSQRYSPISLTLPVDLT